MALSDCIVFEGSNMAECHPVAFRWPMQAKTENGAKLIHVDPRFTRTAAVADLYAPIRPGTDIAFLNGIIRYAIEKKRYHEDYVRIHTNGPYLVGEKFSFQDGLFSGFDAAKGEYDKTAWGYQADEKSQAYGVDPTMQNPRCVFQLLKTHVDRYTPEMVERICGTPRGTFEKVAEIVTSTGNAERVGTITYALGWTQHSTGVQMIRAGATLQLLLGNVGRPGGGMNAFRGHSNIQGATDTGGNTEILPGYLKTPVGTQTTLAEYLETATPTTLNKQAWASMNYWVNYPKFMVSLLKSAWGNAATRENDFGYDWLPKTDGNYSWMYLFDDMYRSLADHSSRALLDRLMRVDLLLIDEMGYLNLRPEQSNIFFKLMEERYGKKATIITTNLNYDDWYGFLGQKEMVRALLDRLRHRCHTIRIEGGSLRSPEA